ncbi:HET-domain-containing protein [Polyporus arcularius HHB13444]|uniref:HET-domain-containing protein n=1 Tax=Polyporus arcularius HHB13444 TaxID=1314778 RepID=A0A5C3NNW0_9APHY|nr:HET-domain-containing protein [Polyporus arcularius HHB13444]
MWLLSTARAELHFYVSPEAVQGGYAILSHVWDAEEQTLQDLQELRKRCSTTGENPRNLVCEKIKRCCELAESHGFEWVWIDTCCIDKTSSAELSEAINSMFQYYSLAGLCYAYLKDVPTEGAFAGYPVAPPFQQSRWHTRGWTLQELIAPRTVIFLSCDWVALGSKVDLAASLELRKGIPADLLRLQRRIPDFSVAQRMSWAAYRTTTRVEDEAYSLLGIFDIMMPTLYGEGRKAFRRLQEEIMRQSADPTLFAWGVCIDPLLLAKTSLNGQALSEPQSYERESRLFAYGPGAFSECGRFTYTSHFGAEDHERDEETSPQVRTGPFRLSSVT